jgi:outer membrane protein assembly factor BamB
MNAGGDGAMPAMESVASRAAVPIRVLAAWLLTSVSLPYVWGRSFIGWQLMGRPEPWVAMALVVVAGAIVALTFHAGSAPAMRRYGVLVGVAVVGAWVAVHVAALWLRVGTVIPRAILALAYVPASLLVPWLTWMFFRPWTWRLRLGVAAPLLGCLVGFVAVFRVEGLWGDSTVSFRWRRVSRVTAPPLRPALAPSVSIAPNPARDFPQFLGRDRTGVLTQARLDANWAGRPPRELWRRPVGEGWSSFAVMGDAAFTQEQRDQNECVVCYGLLTGDEVWVHGDAVNFTSSLGGPGPRATPAVHRGRVYTIGATGLLNCLDARTGRRFWSIDVLKDNGAENIAHGVCASPLVLDDVVVVSPTGAAGPCLAAYDLETGRRRWSGGRHGASYSSPCLAELGGARHLLLFHGDGISGHDPATGRERWYFPWTNSVNTNVSQPIVRATQPDQVFISTGYDRGCALLRVSPAADGTWNAEPLWSNNRLKTKFCSAVALGEYVYGLDDGILTCLALGDGTRQWKGGRYGHGQILLAGNWLLVQAELGDVWLIEPNPTELRELGRVRALPGKTWNNPALAGPYLLVRNDHYAACFELPLAEE